MELTRRRFLRLATISAALAPGLALADCGGTTAPAAGGKVSFQGKTMQSIIGAPVGGGEDDLGRFITQLLVKALPGGPKVEIKNIQGGNGIAAANLFVQTAAKDGTAVGFLGRTLPTGQILGDPAVHFDVRQFEWIGTFSDDDQVLFVRADTGIEDMKGLLNASKPVHFGANNPRVLAYLVAALFRQETGNTNIQPISGTDSGSAAVLLAMERNELQGNFTNYQGLVQARPEWLKPGSPIRIIGRVGTSRDIPGNPPQITDFLSEHSQQLMRLSVLGWGDPCCAPPGTNPDALAVLRQTFDNAVKDPATMEAADKANVGGKPLNAAQIKDIVTQYFTTPPDVVEEYKQLIGLK